MSKWACETCQYYDARESLAVCRRDPPIDNAEGKGIWPAISKTDWCGEYKPAPAAPCASLSLVKSENLPEDLARLGFEQRSDYHWTMRIGAKTFSVWPLSHKWQWDRQTRQGTWANFMTDLDRAKQEAEVHA